MPALISTDIVGKIMWLGCVPDRDANLASENRDEMFATFSGVADEDHSGLTRLSCSRVVTQYPKGTEIRNTRQFCVVSAEEIEAISTKIGIARLDPSWIGASMVIAGIPDFTHIPPSSRLQFDTGTTLVVDMENRPCHLPAKVIDGHLPGVGRAFKAAAKGRRGVTAWVEREGMLRVGDTVRLHIPGQRVWSGA